MIKGNEWKVGFISQRWRNAWLEWCFLSRTAQSRAPALFIFFYFLEARSQVFFLANFCGYWLWDLQAPVARGCMEPPPPGAWLAMQIAKLPKVGSFSCSGLFASQCGDGSTALVCVASLSSVASPAVMVVRPSTARAALPQQSPIGVKLADKRKMSGNLPVRWLLWGDSVIPGKFSVFVNAALCRCSFHTSLLPHFLLKSVFSLCYLLNPTLAPTK